MFGYPLALAKSGGWDFAWVEALLGAAVRICGRRYGEGLTLAFASAFRSCPQLSGKPLFYGAWAASCMKRSAEL